MNISVNMLTFIDIPGESGLQGHRVEEISENEEPRS